VQEIQEIRSTNETLDASFESIDKGANEIQRTNDKVTISDTTIGRDDQQRRLDNLEAALKDWASKVLQVITECVSELVSE